MNIGLKILLVVGAAGLLLCAGGAAGALSGVWVMAILM